MEIADGFSIVICAYNAEGRLPATLEHLAALQFPPNIAAEVILVDNGSTDNTEKVGREVWQKLGSPFQLRVLNEKRPGKGYAVETGYDAARYSYILTVDDDNWLAPDYLVQAVALFEKDSSIGILQGHSTGVFEEEPPVWANELKEFFIIGGPTKEEGYFPENDFYVWGAGMVIKKEDWDYIRAKGFSALTSKLPGKAAGEDNEIAIALMLLGRKIFYSKNLKLQHYMPAGRVNWPKLRQNFETFGYVNHYFFLYTLIIDAYKQGYVITQSVIKKKFLSFSLCLLRRNTLKQHIAFWVMPRYDRYQLMIAMNYAHIKWFIKLSQKAAKDVEFINSWMRPLLRGKPKEMKWVYKLNE